MLFVSELYSPHFESRVFLQLIPTFSDLRHVRTLQTVHKHRGGLRVSQIVPWYDLTSFLAMANSS